MSIVQNIVSDALRRSGLPSNGGQYSRQVEQVVRTLDEALERAVGVIRSAAQGAGISEADVNRVLVDAGLVERPQPTPAPAAADTADEATGEVDRIGRLEAQVTSLGGQVAELVRLAERHLGSARI